MNSINKVVSEVPPYYGVNTKNNEILAIEILVKHIKKGLKVQNYFSALTYNLETKNMDLGKRHGKQEFPFDIYKDITKKYYKTSPAFLFFVNYAISAPVYKILEALDGEYEFTLNSKKDCYEYRLKT